jgi:nicotinate-nucleotide--dimethylbenzimidazole phosphoribosyltransferase
MTGEEAINALKVGVEIFSSENTKQTIDILGLGEMGIANTTSASAIISSVTGISVAECVGRGTGIDDQGLEHKIKVIDKALQFHKPDPKNALDILSSVGGFEIAGMAGAMLAAASQRCAVVLDGLISTSAGLIAYLIDPNVANFMVAGHKSVEKGHIHALKFMNLEPVLDLNMRLGEGTGAALTIDLVDASCHIMCEMASFNEAGVTNNE